MNGNNRENEDKPNIEGTPIEDTPDANYSTELNSSIVDPADNHTMAEWEPKLYALLKRLETPETSALDNTLPYTESDKKLRSEIEQAMLSMPLSYREALDLYEGEELRLHEIAKIIGTDVPGVKWRIYRARTLFRARLSHCFHNNPPVYTGLENEKSDLPVDAELRALVQEWKVPTPSNSLARKLTESYRAQTRQALLESRIEPVTGLKDRLLNLLRTPWSSTLALAISSAVIITLLGFSYWIINHHSNNSNSTPDIVKNTPSPPPSPIAAFSANEKPDQPGNDSTAKNWKHLPAHIKNALPRRRPSERVEPVAPKLPLNHISQPSELAAPPLLERGTAGGSTITTIKHIYVDSLGDDEWSRQLRQILITRLANTGHWKLVDEMSIEQADAVLELSARDNNRIVLVSKGKVIWQQTISRASANQQAVDIINTLLHDSKKSPR